MVKQKEAIKNKFNIFKLAAISGVILVALYILGMFLSSLLQANASVSAIWSVIQGIFVTLFSVVFTFGFYALGKRYDSQLLKIVACLSMLLIVISFLVSLFYVSPILSNLSNIVVQKSLELGIDSGSDSTQAQLVWQELFKDPNFIASIKTVLILFAVYVLSFMILSILLGVSLIRLRDKVKYSKVVGILEIVGAATTVLFVGLIVLLVAFVYELVILFNESKK